MASNSAAPSTANEPDHTGSPAARTTSSDSPVRLASSSARPSADTTVPSATTWSPAASRTRSPTITCSTGTRRSAPSRTTTASGATSAASRSSARLERISWNDPIAIFETRIPTNNASRHDPNVIVSTAKNSRIPLGTVTVFARMMLAYERLERRRGRSPRASRRRAASTSVRPVNMVWVVVTAHRRYRVTACSWQAPATTRGACPPKPTPR